MATPIALQLAEDQTHGLDPKKNWNREKRAFVPEEEPVPDGEHVALPGGIPPAILVVDDNFVVLKAFETKLKADGFTVITTPNAAGVAAIAESAKVDVILLDINFPPAIDGGEWSGFTVMHWLKRLAGLGNIPVIMITGSEQPQYREKALAAGAVALFEKPVNYFELRKAILEALGSRPEKV
jgi:CheY-like chemotaxis protein